MNYRNHTKYSTGIKRNRRIAMLSASQGRGNNVGHSFKQHKLGTGAKIGSRG